MWKKKQIYQHPEIVYVKRTMYVHVDNEKLNLRKLKANSVCICSKSFSNIISKRLKTHVACSWANEFSLHSSVLSALFYNG